ncbi:MAG: TIGR03905 family TSCPD domain-containing protein [Defluviitaleaceae bacterium]|nr:TIGR03905 family TSCPD domain-containing protein [Defluviitaleaceae bacterium]
MKYKPKGVCSSEIDYEIENGAIKELSFKSGCEGNLKGIATLAKGMQASELIDKLKGIRCGRKDTSCPDQLARALEAYTKNER